MNNLSDPNNQLQELEEKELLVKSLRHLFRGDAQLIADSIPEFHKDEEVQTLLKDFRALQQRFYDRWVALGFSVPMEALFEETSPSESDEGASKANEDSQDSEDTAEVRVESDRGFEIDLKSELDSGFGVERDPEVESEIDSGFEIELDSGLKKENDSRSKTGIDPVVDQDASLDQDEGWDQGLALDQGADRDQSVDGNLPAEDPIEDDAIVINLDPVDTSPSQPPEIHVVIPKRIRIDYPNGKVDQPYSYSIPFEKLNLDSGQISDLKTSGFTESGLVFSSEEWEVKGLPEEQGQFSLEIHLDYINSEGRKGQMILEGACNINPDPRSLWQEHEPPADALYQKSHTDAARLETKEAVLIGASRRGRSHAHKGDFRDDDFLLSHTSASGWYILAVADGAGSAKYSREGSRLAVEITSQRLEELLDDEFTRAIEKELDGFSDPDHPDAENNLRLHLYDSIGGSVFDGYKAILGESEQQDSAPRDYATTLLITVTRKFEQGWFFASYWVGDGCVGVYQKGKSVQLLGSPDGGEFAGQTRFFTMAEIWQDAKTILGRLQFTLVPDFTALCLMTDGISDPKFQTDYNLRQVPQWDNFWEDLHTGVNFSEGNDQQDQELLEWLNFWSQGDHDDRSLVIMYPKRTGASS